MQFNKGSIRKQEECKDKKRKTKEYLRLLLGFLLVGTGSNLQVGLDKGQALSSVRRHGYMFIYVSGKGKRTIEDCYEQSVLVI